MVVIFYFLGIFRSFAFRFDHPSHFCVLFVNVLKQVKLGKFQTFTSVYCVIIAYIVS